METINDRMTAPVLSIDHEKNIKSAAEIIYGNQIGSLLVTRDENFVGIITKTDLMIRVLIEDLDSEVTRVADVMSKTLITIDVDETLDSAKKLLDEKSIRHLTVTQDDEVVGVLSVKDLR